MSTMRSRVKNNNNLKTGGLHNSTPTEALLTI